MVLLLAGWTVRSPSLEAGATLPADHCTACRAADRRRRPTDEQLQCPIVRTLLLTQGQLLRIDRAKHRAAVGIHHGHYHLRPTRRVEHDPIQSGPAGADLHELTYRGHLHRTSLLRAGPLDHGPRRQRAAVRPGQPGGAHWRLSTISLARDQCPAVACMWIADWNRARAAGDTVMVRRAIAAMATAPTWPILHEMAKEGAWPQVLIGHAQAMPRGTWYGRPLAADVDSGLGCSEWGVSLGTRDRLGTLGVVPKDVRRPRVVQLDRTRALCSCRRGSRPMSRGPPRGRAASRRTESSTLRLKWIRSQVDIEITRGNVFLRRHPRDKSRGD